MGADAEKLSVGQSVRNQGGADFVTYQRMQERQLCGSRSHREIPIKRKRDEVLPKGCSVYLCVAVHEGQKPLLFCVRHLKQNRGRASRRGRIASDQLTVAHLQFLAKPSTKQQPWISKTPPCARELAAFGRGYHHACCLLCRFCFGLMGL